MEVTGKIIVALPEMSGTSKTGNAWKKREYVLETQDQFPKKVHFDFFGERADQYPLSVVDTIKLSFDIESREYNGRWYNDIRAWRVVPAQSVAPVAPTVAPAAPEAVIPAPVAAPAAPEDDLPF